MTTTTLSSSWVITASVNPPRATFVNYPLGHTAGRPGETHEQVRIVTQALELVHDAETSGTIRPVDLEWPESWRTKARELSDKRTERFDTAQYQLASDKQAAEACAGDPLATAD